MPTPVNRPVGVSCSPSPIHHPCGSISPYSLLIAAIRILDPEVQEDELGFTSNALGFGVYTEAKDTQPEQPAEAVIVFRKDYYAGL